MANIHRKLDRVVKALQEKPANLIDFTDEINEVMNRVYGPGHYFDRLVLGEEFLRNLELIYGKKDNDREQQS